MTATEQDKRATILNKLLTYESSKLGLTLQEYVLESDNQGWEGSSDTEVSGFYRVLNDMLLYLDNKD